MFINLYLYIIIILSSCYLLYKNDLLNFKDKKTILVSIFYVIISSYSFELFYKTRNFIWNFSYSYAFNV